MNSFLRFKLTTFTDRGLTWIDNASDSERTDRSVPRATGKWPLSVSSDRIAVAAMLDDLNVRRNTWWGYGLHVVFGNIRVPYTAVGFRYDLNHGRWYGPNAGN